VNACDRWGERRQTPRWVRFGATALLAAVLAACGGSDGTDGKDGATGATGPAGPAGPPGQDANATLNASILSAAQWSEMSLTATVTSVEMGTGTPVVKFKLADANGTPVSGMAQKNAAGAYPNFGFAVAKLIPSDTTTKAPSRWVSYMIVTTPAAGKAAVPGFPEVENDGTLTDNLDGSYTYTFALDLSKVKGYVDGATFDATHLKADLDDVSYQPTYAHRLLVTVGGNQPGTTTAMAGNANVAYDFIPSTGKPTTATDPQRDIVAIASCNGCHSKLSMHASFFPAIEDTKLCAVCHTTQHKFGFTENRPASGFNLVPQFVYGQNVTFRLDGRAVPDFPNMVHKIHMGEELLLQGYNQFGVMYNEVTYPQPQANCVKCHSASTATPQGDNWKMAPSRLACGACHDGINFATGGGQSLGDGYPGHVGRAQADDSQCATCHTAAAIPVYHVTVDMTGSSGRAGYPLNTADNVPTPGYPSGQGPSIPLASQLNLPAGVYKIGLEIKSAALAANKVTVVYRIMKDGSPVTMNTTGFLINNVDGSPYISIAYAALFDGNATPADWTGRVDTTVKDIRDSKSGWSQTGPDANGYYTATRATALPAGSRMVTVGLGINYQGFVQLNHPSYPNGIRLREPGFAMMLASGSTDDGKANAPRRKVVDNANCNNCHGQLGVGPSFHGGARNNGEGCAFCHMPDTATSHIGAANSFGGGWSVSAKNLVHGIHASGFRNKAFTYEATAENPNGFQEVTYPGVLNNCEQCHVAGSYDFSGAANSAAVPNLLWTTEAKGDMTNPIPPATTAAPSIGLSPWVTLLGRGQVDYRSDNLVSSPIASACFGCHDSNSTLTHMLQNGGSVYASASTVTATGTGSRAKGFKLIATESCLTCHGPGTVAAIKAMHMK